MTQLIAHLFGDYCLQSHWLATQKVKRSLPCLVHCLLYTTPFALITQSWFALATIFGSHFLLDRFRLAKRVCWFHNWLQPGGYFPFSWCSMTGFFDHEVAYKQARGTLAQEICQLAHSDPETNAPEWLRFFVLIVIDNSLHLLCNYLAIGYL